MREEVEEDEGVWFRLEDEDSWTRREGISSSAEGDWGLWWPQLEQVLVELLDCIDELFITAWKM